MPTGLIRRGARYSIRRRIPLDLVEHYGRKEIIKALNTPVPAVARWLLPLAWAALDAEFDAARASLAKPDSAPPAPPVDPHAVAARVLVGLRRRREEAAAAGRLPEFNDGLEGSIMWETAVLNGEEPTDRPLTSHEGVRMALRAMLTGEGAASIPSPPQAKPEPAQPNTDAVTLDALIDRWARERQPDAKTENAHRAVARRFKELAGSIPVQSIAKRDVLTFKDGLLGAGDTPANVNVKLTRLRTLLNFAFHNDLIGTQPATGVSVLDPDEERRKRRPFDRAALKAIFEGPVHAQDERPTQGRGEAAYWLPLLALYTGARMEELGQLRTSDVRQEAYLNAEDAECSAWVLNITEDDEDGLSIKNAGSERFVPIHADLGTLGFIRFAQDAQAAGQARLFPALKADVYGKLTAKWGEWFSLYKRECGVADRRMVFHSFRHTFKDNARHSGMIEGVQRKIMGHAGKDVADAYGSGYGLHPLVEGMKLYRVPGFTLPAPPPSYRD